jgi:hypothetical protein
MGAALLGTDGQQHKGVLRRAAVHDYIQGCGGGDTGGGIRGKGGCAIGGTARLCISGGGLGGVVARGDGGGVVGAHIAHHVLWEGELGGGGMSE